MRSILAIVPARGGSKGIPGKNLVELHGRPLIAWTIEAARGASCVERCVVTTDSREIAEVARAWGAEAPFLRPAELAADSTPGIDPVLHCVDWLKAQESYDPDAVLILQPTSPLRSVDDIMGAVELMKRRKADSVVSVTAVEHHPYWMKLVNEEGRLCHFWPEFEQYPQRQDLPPVYALNGAIYLCKTRTLVETRSLYHERTYAYIMPEERSLDIDLPWHLRAAEGLLRAKSAARSASEQDEQR